MIKIMDDRTKFVFSIEAIEIDADIREAYEGYQIDQAFRAFHGPFAHDFILSEGMYICNNGNTNPVKANTKEELAPVLVDWMIEMSELLGYTDQQLGRIYEATIGYDAHIDGATRDMMLETLAGWEAEAGEDISIPRDILTLTLNKWCSDNGLPQECAEDLLRLYALNDLQRAWLTKFISRWDAND